MHRPERPLYVMLKPPPVALDLIWQQPEVSRSRPSELLHCTVLPLGNAAFLEPQVLDVIKRALGAVRARPFLLDFDRIRGRGGSVELVRRGTNREAVAFRAHVIETMSRYVSAPWPRSFRPHITLDYRRSAPCDRLIDPISWLVEDFLLIESVTGETRHIEHERWPLRTA